MLKNDTIFIAGHETDLGGALVSLLRAEGYCNLLAFPSQALDLRRKDAVRACFAEYRPKLVFVLNDERSMGTFSDSKPTDTMSDQLQLQDAVTEAAIRFKAAKLILVAPEIVYSKQATMPLSEAELFKGPANATPLKSFAMAKLSGLEQLKAINAQETATQCLGVIMPKPYTLASDADMTAMDPKMVQVDWVAACYKGIQQAVNSGEASVTLAGEGKWVRDWLSVTAAAKSIVNLALCPTDTLKSQINFEESPYVNVNGPERMTLMRVAKTIAAHLGFEGQINFSGGFKEIPPKWTLDVARAKALGILEEERLKSLLKETQASEMPNMSPIS